MVADSEKFAEEDELIKKKIEARNQFENCKFYRPPRVKDFHSRSIISIVIYSLKSQIADDAGLGGKLDAADKKTINAEIKKSQDWLEEFGASAASEDYDEQREALSAIVTPITSKVVR